MNRKYSPEMRERALRMLAETRPSHPNMMSAVRHVAGLLGMSPEMLRLWQRRYEVDAGVKPGLTTDAAAEITRLQKENAELRKANEMADSSGGRNEFCELLRWCQIAERFAWSSVERVLDRGQLSAGDDAQIGALRQVLA
ncbi:transposase IS3/IS911 family protein [Microbacterium laevaniformans OR221]|nr:transposase IS3/IS911 family protein [Microbacterium laevaniformans OR221]